MNTEQNEIAAEVLLEKSTTTALEQTELDSQKAIARISSIAQILDGCTKASIQRTNSADWVKIGKNYYLQASGAQKIRPLWGIYYKDRQVTKEIYPDGSYGFLVTGKVGSKVLDFQYGEVTIEIDGGRSSLEPFFSGKDGSKFVNPINVRKAALANWEARAVTAILGLKNLTAEDLEKNGISTKEIATVTYQSGAEGGGRVDLISVAQRKRLFALCKNFNYTDEKLKTYLKNKYNIDSTLMITKNQYEEICNAIEEGRL